MADSCLILIVVLCEIISISTVAKGYDTCFTSYGYSFQCYGEHEYCCNNDFDCCRMISTGAIIGIIAGMVFGVVLIVMLVCICIRKSRQRPAVIVRQNQPFEVSYIAYNRRHGNNQNLFLQQMAPAKYGFQPPPYSTVSLDFSQSQPYSTAQTDWPRPQPYSTAQTDLPRSPSDGTVQADSPQS